jgi:hypothetical protein
MKINFPSPEFEDAVAAVCHGSATDGQARALNELLRNDAGARDAYILRLEVHSRLASDTDLFAAVESAPSVARGGKTVMSFQNVVSPQNPAGQSSRRIWAIALAACIALLAAAVLGLRLARPAERSLRTSKAVAVLNRTADAQWNGREEIPRLGAPLEPGWLRLEAGLAQVVFYSGARVVVEGPTELRLISQNEAALRQGRIVVEVPPEASGFRVDTPHTAVTDLGTSFGLEVKDRRTELHLFKGKVKLRSGAGAADQTLQEGSGALMENGRTPRPIAANPAAFASLFDLQARSVAAEARRLDQWRTACKRLKTDSSLQVHFDFENVAPSGWQLHNVGDRGAGVSDATIVGCQWVEGRWPEKRALEFHSVSDRVRLNVPGEFDALTFSAWICVKGLDRKINSLFMSDGFEPRTVHWLIRRDGVLGLTVIGAEPRTHQIVASPPVATLEKFGMWLHVAVVLDGNGKRVVHYLNGAQVSEHVLKIAPPFRIGAAELGNWNAKGFPENDPFMIRNFSGTMDEFCLFSRALDAHEVRALYAQGKPQPDSIAAQRKN